MVKKILYGVGGVIGLFILIGIFAPSPEPTPIQQTPIVAQEETTAEVEVNEPIASTPEPEQKTTEVHQPAVEQTQKPPSVPVQTQPQFQYYAVTDVVDGDTLKINMNGTVETLRLIGIDTPETVDPRKPVQCFGTEASNRAKALLSGQKVRIEADPTQDTRDRYGRLLVYIYRDDGLFFNKAMVADGYAYEYTYDKAYKYQAEFKVAQLAAQNVGKGLWSPNTCNGVADPVSSDTDTQTTGKYHTSSYGTSKYYYLDSCDGWQDLKYLESFNTLEELLAKYDRDLSPQCQ
ncbi:MAG: thermonuclease family protein [bacterium]|nr:thermonuclease family protein [bacterium]